MPMTLLPLDRFQLQFANLDLKDKDKAKDLRVRVKDLKDLKARDKDPKAKDKTLLLDLAALRMVLRVDLGDLTERSSVEINHLLDLLETFSP